MTPTYKFETHQEKFQLLYCWIYIHACQCESSMWESGEYGIQRTHALRYVEYHMEKTNWAKAYPAILMYSPKLVDFARRDCREFVEKYGAQDPEYLKLPQIIAVLRMLAKMKKTVDEPKSNPYLSKADMLKDHPKKPRKKK